MLEKKEEIPVDKKSDTKSPSKEINLELTNPWVERISRLSKTESDNYNVIRVFSHGMRDFQRYVEDAFNGKTSEYPEDYLVRSGREIVDELDHLGFDKKTKKELLGLYYNLMYNIVLGLRDVEIGLLLKEMHDGKPSEERKKRVLFFEELAFMLYDPKHVKISTKKVKSEEEGGKTKKPFVVIIPEYTPSSEPHGYDPNLREKYPPSTFPFGDVLGEDVFSRPVKVSRFDLPEWLLRDRWKLATPPDPGYLSQILENELYAVLGPSMLINKEYQRTMYESDDALYDETSFPEVYTFDGSTLIRDYLLGRITKTDTVKSFLGIDPSAWHAVYHVPEDVDSSYAGKKLYVPTMLYERLEVASDALEVLVARLYSYGREQFIETMTQTLVKFLEDESKKLETRMRDMGLPDDIIYTSQYLSIHDIRRYLENRNIKVKGDWVKTLMLRDVASIQNRYLGLVEILKSYISFDYVRKDYEEMFGTAYDVFDQKHVINRLKPNLFIPRWARQIYKYITKL